jgi:hypothetical protein
MSKTFEALVSEIMTDNGQIKNHLGWVFLTALLILVLVAFGPAAAVFYLALSDVDKYKALGPWADFISGTLTPILTLFTFIGVLITVVLQKIALSITQEESKRSAIAQEKQNFEATFFQMYRCTTLSLIQLIWSIRRQEYEREAAIALESFTLA